MIKIVKVNFYQQEIIFFKILLFNLLVNLFFDY